MLSAIFLLALSGCFRVGRLPATTASGPSYDDSNSAIVVPKGDGCSVLSVNGESVQTDLGDRLANFSLNFLLMYLEPQVYVKPGQNLLSVRGSNSSSVNYGDTKVTTTRWRDYALRLNAAVGKRYLVHADVDSGTSIALDTSETKAAPVAVASNDAPAPEMIAPKPHAKKNAKTAKKSAHKK